MRCCTAALEKAPLQRFDDRIGVQENPLNSIPHAKEGGRGNICPPSLVPGARPHAGSGRWATRNISSMEMGSVSLLLFANAIPLKCSQKVIRGPGIFTPLRNEFSCVFHTDEG